MHTLPSRAALYWLGRALLWLLPLVLTAATGTAVHTTSEHEQPTLGFHIPRGDDAHMKAASEAGADFVVIVFSWRDIEPSQGYFYWIEPDAAIRAAKYYGLQVVARLDRPPAWAEAPDGPTPWQLPAYAEFARRVAERYGDDLAGVVIWNEPNLAAEWNGLRPDPAGYVEMLSTAYRAVKQQSADLPVAVAGLAFTLSDDDVAQNDLMFFEEVLATGGAEYFDVLTLHPYGFGRPPDDAPDPQRLNFRRLELHRHLLVEHGYAEKTAWITESGWRTSAPNVADAWQIVPERQQVDYSLAALAQARANHPWIERFAFWELNREVDDYGYALWRGGQDATALYRQFAAAHCEEREPQPSPRAECIQEGYGDCAVEILRSDAIVRLGGLGTLHPHWVHMYRSEGEDRLTWQGEFFLTEPEPVDHFLLLETMQVDQPANWVLINGKRVGRLTPRARPDPTSTWVTQRLPVRFSHLRLGTNIIEIEVGYRNPTRQYGWWRHENLQLRNIRLIPSSTETVDGEFQWQSLGAPGGWGEVIRLRPTVDDSGALHQLWTTTNRGGGLWLADVDDNSPNLEFVNWSGDMTDTLFLDILPTDYGYLAATERGLYFRRSVGDPWVRAPGSPEGYVHFVVNADDVVYAGIEGQGLWQWTPASARWERSGLEDLTPLDMVIANSGAVFVTTDDGVYERYGTDWNRLPDFPPEVYEGPHGRVGGAFSARLYLDSDGRLIVMNQDRLWKWNVDDGWAAFGPEELQGRLYSVIDCCTGQLLLAADGSGIWKQGPGGTWRRWDEGYFDRLEPVGGVAATNGIVIGTTNGVFLHSPAGNWLASSGLETAVTDIVVLDGEREIWLASTPAGVFRSADHGMHWEAVSPPWIVWSLAVGEDQRVFAARSSGVAWTDSPLDQFGRWTNSQGLEGVTFFAVRPDVGEDGQVWTGTWGNDIGISFDRGATITSLNNGLETLSVLDIWAHAVEGQFTVGTIEGLYRSDDGGQNWFKLPGPLQRQTVYAVHQAADGRLMAGASNGLWTSEDCGANWTRAEGMPVATVLWLGSQDRGGDDEQLWAGTEQLGLWVSHDLGGTWEYAGLDGLTVFSVAFPEADRALAATSAGLSVSDLDGVNRRDSGK